MARLRLDLPDRFRFETDIPLQIRDINYGGHLGNDAVLSLAHEARIRFFIHYGLAELGVESARLVVADAAVIYRSEAFYGEVLRAEVCAADPNKYGFDLFYRFSEKASNREVARLKTGIVFLNRESGKVTRTPEPFLRMVAAETRQD